MSRRPKRHVVKRIAPGRYDYRGRCIIRTTWEGTGVRGGTRHPWEIGEYEQGVPVLDGYHSASTLREARRIIDRLLDDADARPAAR